MSIAVFFLLIISEAIDVEVHDQNPNLDHILGLIPDLDLDPPVQSIELAVTAKMEKRNLNQRTEMFRQMSSGVHQNAMNGAVHAIVIAPIIAKSPRNIQNQRLNRNHHQMTEH